MDYTEPIKFTMCYASVKRQQHLQGGGASKEHFTFNMLYNYLTN